MLPRVSCGRQPGCGRVRIRSTVNRPCDAHRFPRGTITLGVVVIFMTTMLVRGTSAFGLLGGAALLGLGMGSLYPDLLGRCLSEPAADDGISPDRMAAAVVLAESIGTALSTTAAYTWLGTGLGLVGDPLRRDPAALPGAAAPRRCHDCASINGYAR